MVADKKGEKRSKQERRGKEPIILLYFLVLVPASLREIRKPLRKISVEVQQAPALGCSELLEISGFSAPRRTGHHDQAIEALRCQLGLISDGVGQVSHGQGGRPI